MNKLIRDERGNAGLTVAFVVLSVILTGTLAAGSFMRVAVQDREVAHLHLSEQTRTAVAVMQTELATRGADVVAAEVNAGAFAPASYIPLAGETYAYSNAHLDGTTFRVTTKVGVPGVGAQPREFTTEYTAQQVVVDGTPLTYWTPNRTTEPTP